MLAVLKNRTYRHLFLAQVIALLEPGWRRLRSVCRLTSFRLAVRVQCSAPLSPSR